MSKKLTNFLADKPKAKKSFDSGGVRVSGGIDPLIADIQVSQLDNIDDLRGERQSAWVQTRNGVAKGVAKLGARTLEGFGTIGALLYTLGGQAKDVATGEDDTDWSDIYNNEMTKGFDAFYDALNEELPNYYTDEEQESFRASVGNVNFWADKLLDGASYAGAAYLSGAGIAKGIGASTKAFAELINKGTKFNKFLSTASTGVDEAVAAARAGTRSTRAIDRLAASANKFANNDAFVRNTASYLAAASEASIEARGVYNDIKDTLYAKKIEEKELNGDFSPLNEQELKEIDDKAAAGGNVNLLTNFFLVGVANKIQLGKYFKSGNFDEAASGASRLSAKAQKKITHNVDTGKFELAAKSTSLYGKVKRGANTAFDYTKNNILTEVGEEAGQLAASTLLTSYFSADEQDSNQLLESMSGAFKTTFGSNEGWESMLLGGLIGGGTGALTGSFKAKEAERAELDAVISKLNDYRKKKPELKIFKDSAAKSVVLQEGADAALEDGNQVDFDTLMDTDFTNLVNAYADAGQLNVLMDDLESYKSTDVATFKEANGIEAYGFNNQEIAQQLIDKANKINSVRKRIISKYGQRLDKDGLEALIFVEANEELITDRYNKHKQVLKEKFGYDIDIHRYKAKFLENTDYLTDSNKTLVELKNKSLSLKETLRKQEKEQNLEKDSLVNTDKNLRAINSDLVKLSNAVNNLENDVTFNSILTNASNATLNSLQEASLRDTVDGLTATKREEFKDNLAATKQLETLKNQYLKIHNNLIDSKGYTAYMDDMKEKVNKIKNDKFIERQFTVDGKEDEFNTNGRPTGEQKDSKVILKDGVYVGDLVQESYKDNFEPEGKKVNTTANVYEIRGRRINAQTGQPQVYLSTNGGRFRWAEVATLGVRNLVSKQGGKISPEHTFYFQNKDRLISIELQEGYATKAQAEKVVEESPTKYGGKQVKVDGKYVPKMITKRGFLGLNRNGDVEFRVLNPKTNKFEPYNQFYIQKTGKENEKNRVAYQPFKVSQKANNNPLYFKPSYEYVQVFDKASSEDYLFAAGLTYLDTQISKDIAELEALPDELTQEDDKKVQALQNKMLAYNTQQLKELQNELKRITTNISRNVPASRIKPALDFYKRNLEDAIKDLSRKLAYQQNRLETLKIQQSLLKEKKVRRNPSLSDAEQERADLEKQIDEKGTKERELDKIAILATRAEEEIAMNKIALEQIEPLMADANAMLDDAISAIMAHPKREELVRNVITKAGEDGQTMQQSEVAKFVREYPQIFTHILDPIDELDAEIGLKETEGAHVQATIKLRDTLKNLESTRKAYIKNNYPMMRTFRETTLGKRYKTFQSTKEVLLHALNAELDAYKRLRFFATKDDRLIRERVSKVPISSKNTLETIDVDSVDVNDFILPSFEHNGDPNAPEAMHFPFMKTISPDRKRYNLAKATDYEKAEYIWNLSIPKLDVDKYKIQVVDKLPSGYTPPAYDGKHKQLFTILVDNQGNPVKMDTTGKVKEDGYLVFSQMMAPTWKTLDGEGVPRFHDVKLNEDGTPVKEENNRSLEAYAAYRSELENELNNGESVYLEITGKSFGIRRFDPSFNKETKVGNLLSDVIDYDLSDPNQSIKIATGKSITINGVTYPTKAGFPYYENRNNGIVIPLHSRKLNEADVNDIRNAMINHDNGVLSDNDLLNNFLNRKVMVEESVDYSEVDRSYNVKFTDNEFSTIEYSENLNGTWVTKTISIEHFRNVNSTEYKDFGEFITRRTHQVDKTRLDNATKNLHEAATITDEDRVNEIKKSNRFGHPFTGNGKQPFSANYVNYLLKNVLTSDMLPTQDLSTSTGTITPQWTNGYLRLGNEVNLDEFNATTNEDVDDGVDPDNAPDILGEGDTPTFTVLDDEDAEFNSVKNAAVGNEDGEDVKPKPDKKKKGKDGRTKFDPVAFAKLQNEINTDGSGITLDDLNDLVPDGKISNANKNGSAGLFNDIDRTDSNEGGFPLASNPITDSQPKITDEALNKAAERIKERYGIPVEKVKGLIRGGNYGMVMKAAKVLLSDNAPVGVDHHEEFHVVEQLIFDEGERQSYYKQWRDSNPDQKDFSDSQVSEALAEEYRYYALTRDVQAKKSWLKSMFDKIRKFLENLISLNNDPVINELFNDIYVGEFSKENVQRRAKLSLNTNQKEQLYNSLLYYRNYFIQAPEQRNADNKNVGGLNVPILAYYSNRQIKVAADKAVPFRFQAFKPMLEKLFKKVTPEHYYFVATLEGMQHRKGKEGRLSPEITNLLRKKSEFVNLFNEYQQYLRLNVAQTEEAQADFTETENEIEDVKGARKEEYRNSNETDFVGKPLKLAKLLLNSIPSADYNSLGVKKSIDIEATLRQITKDVSDTSSLQEILDVLKHKNDPTYTQIYKALDFTRKAADASSPAFGLSIVNAINIVFKQFAKSYLDHNTYSLQRDENGKTFSFKEFKEIGKAAQRATITSNYSNFAIELSKDAIPFMDKKTRKVNYSVLKGYEKSISKAKGRADLSKRLSDVMNAFGFDIDEKTFDGVDPDVLKTKLTYFLEDYQKKTKKNKDTVINPFNDRKKISNVNDLIDAQNFGNDHVYNEVVLNAKGRMTYPIQESNTLTKVVKSLRSKFPNIKAFVYSGFKDSYVDSKGNTINNLGENNNDLSSTNSFAIFLNNAVRGKFPYIFTGSKSMSYGLEGLSSFDKDVSAESVFRPFLLKEINAAINLRDAANESTTAPKGAATGNSKGMKLNVMADILPTNIVNTINEAILTQQSPIKSLEDLKKSDGKKAITAALNRNIDESFKRHLRLKSRDWVNQMTSLGLFDTDVVGQFTTNKIAKDVVKAFNLTNTANANIFAEKLYLNSFNNFALQTEKITGNLAYFKDFLKRSTGLMGTRTSMNLDPWFINYFNQKLRAKDSNFVARDTVKVVTANDITIDMSDMSEAVATADAKAAYKKVNLTDAQGYETIEFYRFRRLSEGTWFKQHEDVYNKIKNNETLSKNDVYLMVNKTQGYSYYDYNGIKVPVFIKTSVIIPSLVKGTKLEAVAEKLDKEGIGMMLFESAVKVGQLVDKKTEKAIELFDKEGNVNAEMDLQPYTMEVDLKYYGTQLTTSEKPKNNVTKATQAAKLILSNLDNRGLTSTEKQELIQEYHDLEKDRVDLLRDRLYERLNLKANQSLKDADINVIRDILIDESIQRDLPSVFIENLKYMLNNFKNLDLVARKNKIESVLLSIVNNSIIKSKVKGDQKALVSNVGFDTVTESTELKFYPPNPSKPEDFVMEVYLPSYFAPKENRGHEIQKVDIKNLNKKALTALGIRIPTQGLNAMEVIRVKGFLPKHMGNAIVVPKGITAKTGADFDIDKMTIYFPHLNPDGTYIDPSVVNEEELDTAGKLRVAENRILQFYIDQIQHPANREEVLTPNTDYDIKGIIKGQGDSKYPVKDSIVALRDNATETGDSKFLDMMYLLEKKNSFEVGKNTLGQFALHGTSHVLSQLYNLHFNPKALPNLSFDIPNIGRLDKVKATDGTFISKNIEQLQNAAVDVEKDDYLLDANINVDTAGIASTLVRLGLPLKDTLFFLGQPIIKDYIAEKSRLKALYPFESNRRIEALTTSKIANKYNEPVADSTRIKLTTLELTRQLSNPKAKTQRYILNEYFKVKELANVLNGFMNITTYDTKGASTSINGTEILESNYRNFFDNTNVAEKNVPYLYNTNRFFDSKENGQTLIGRFKEVVEESNDMFKGLFKNKQYLSQLEDKGFAMIDSIKKAITSFDRKVRALNIINNELITYILQNMNRNSLQTRKKELLYGDKSPAAILHSIQNAKDNAFTNNGLIKELNIVIGSETSPNLIHLKASNAVSNDRSNIITEGFYELYDYNPKLVLDLIEASILQSGVQNSRTTLFNVIPADLLMEVAETYYNGNLDVKLSNFELNLARNNQNNRLIVPKLTNKGKVPAGYKYAVDRKGRLTNGNKQYFARDNEFVKDYGSTATIQSNAVASDINDNAPYSVGELMEALDTQPCS